MSGGDSGFSHAKGGGNQDFELNIASMIDCFTVLITFLLASASFISIGIMDAGVAAAGTTATDATPPSLIVTVELGDYHGLTLKLSGKSNKSIPIPAHGDQWDYDTLGANLAQVRTQYPDVKAATVTAGNRTEYKDVVKAMEVVRQRLPIVALGGF